MIMIVILIIALLVSILITALFKDWIFKDTDWAEFTLVWCGILIIVGVIIGLLTALLEYDTPPEVKEPIRVKTITVVDVVTKDTIQIELSNNPGIVDKAYKINK